MAVTYLDHAATAGMSEAALAAYVAAAEVVGNPSSLHSAGRAARNIVEDARESIAANMGAHPTEVVFTSGGTESNNLALKGIYWAQVERDPQRRGLLVSAIEHHSVLEPARWLARHGARLTLIPVTRDGAVTLEALTPLVSTRSVCLPTGSTAGVITPDGFETPLRGSSTDGSAQPAIDVILHKGPRRADAESLTPAVERSAGISAEVETKGVNSCPALVSVMLASNEIGTIQPIAELAELAHRHQVPFHTDAVAALGQIPVSFAGLGVDAMSVAAHKIGGPLGVGALIVRRDLRIEPLLHGGEQERGLRSGTVDVPGVAAFAAALAEATANLNRFQTHTSLLRDQIVNGVLTTIPGAILSGPGVGGGRSQADRIEGRPDGFETPLRGSSTDGTAQPPSISGAILSGSVPPTVILRPREAGSAESLSAAGELGTPAVELGTPAVERSAGEPAEVETIGVTNRLPANASFVFPGADPDALLFGLDNAGFAASIGAACAAGVARPSEALVACGFSVGEAKSSLRFTLGSATSSEDIAQLLRVLPGVVAAARM